MSNGRRFAASGALIATAAGVAAIGLHDLRWIEWSLVASSGVIALAGVGLARKSMVAQVLSRAAAWVVFAPAAIVTVVSTLGGHHPELAAAAFAVGSGSALLLARPMLHTAEARAEFAPSRFRSWLLAGATASTATAMVTAFIGLDAISRSMHGWGSLSVAAGFLALATALLGSALGVMRMRTWGILLSGLTALATFIVAAVLHDPAAGLALSLTALPGLLFFIMPVLVAKQARAKAERNDTRIALPSAVDELPSRVRVATEEADPYADEFEPSPPPAARAQHVS